MSRRVSISNNQTIKMPMRGLNTDEISQIQNLNMLAQAERIKTFTTRAREAHDFCVASLIMNRERLNLLKTEQPNNKSEINRISNMISNLEIDEPKLDQRLHNLELNLAERIAMMEELNQTRHGRTLVMLPSAPKASGRKKKKTRKRKKRKTRRRK
tara:strand:- start:570 stop:1037 length:468 start_codon:yes stop_codon:yes gene_type:complete